jgi:lipoprotein-anchoring transpeptidase ErfK/SrfK
LDKENVNTRERYIYIHGTKHEERIGTPDSHGCIRMRNDDVIELFDLVAEGTPVLIRA